MNEMIVMLAVDMGSVVQAGLVIGITGLLIGVLLCVAAKKFAVEVDQKELDIRYVLPGNNCV